MAGQEGDRRFGAFPTYTIAELEDAASRILREKLGSEAAIPIDVELILQRLSDKGVLFDYWPGLRENHQLDGMACHDVASDVICVFIDEGLADHGNPNRYRMTVAEELGHVVLHANVIRSIKSPEDFLSLHRDPFYPRMDRNAKRFAAAVLMPKKSVTIEAQKLFPRLIEVAGFDNVDAVLNTMTSQLAQIHQVSSQTMGIRLREWPMRIADKVRSAMCDRIDYLE